MKFSGFESVFGQIWSQKLKFSKFTKIWYKGTLLYPWFEFNVCFTNFFFIDIFLGKFGPKIWSSPDQLKFWTGVHCSKLITILMFILPKFLSLMFLGKFGPIIWISSNCLKFCRGIHCYLFIAVLMSIFSNFFPFISFGQIWSQNLNFPK